MLPPEERLEGAQLHRYIRDKLYWTLHAPRQTGKTTFLQSWGREINAGDEALACYVTVERCQGQENPAVSIPGICDAIREFAKWTNLPVPESKTGNPVSMLSEILVNWAEKTAPKPLVVLFDEVDVLEGDALIAFLRQLRSGFAMRGVGKFPVSIALVGMRDLKDYITLAKGGVPVNPGSPFNIKEDSVVIGNFSQSGVVRLFSQRTEETGQEITQEALDYVWEQSRGQPWIVNSLFKRATMRLLDEESAEMVTRAHIAAAREQMILARETHLDALAFRMNNKAVRQVMETLMSGEINLQLAETDAFRQCLDLGLVTLENGTPTVANPIYREVLARDMTYGAQIMIPPPEFRWQTADGGLDMDALLKEFQQFWRENSEIWEEQSGYSEVFPHLLLQAFLQRVLNGGGSIDREYAAGRGRMDLCVEYNSKRHIPKRHIIEVKLIKSYTTPERVRRQGLEQIRRYRDRIDPAAPAYLVIFDRRPEAKERPWDKRLSWAVTDGVTVIGC